MMMTLGVNSLHRMRSKPLAPSRACQSTAKKPRCTYDSDADEIDDSKVRPKPTAHGKKMG
ncbi:hypothetical protein ACHAW5_007957 [Stephanodiscus triporus]|uniref:Uncharacterized protein n=1 Tax=Stephanodiscus triporus TaxID=2934178 RepID=A0ABD3NCI2_9STRA